VFKLLRYLRISIESLRAHKLRAGLTTLGIVIGVAAVLTTVGIGRGAAGNITQQIQSQGTNLLIVLPGSSNSSGVSQGGGSAQTLTMADVSALEDRSLNPALDTISPVYGGNAVLVYGATNTRNNIVGTTADYAAVRNLDVAEGSFLSSQQVQQQQAVVVLGATLASDLFGSADPLNQIVTINGQPFQVIGVLKATGGFGFTSNDMVAFVPIQVAQGRLFNANRYRGEYTVNSIDINVKNSDLIQAAEGQIDITLRLNHGLTANQADDFQIFNQASLLATASQVTATLTIFLGAIGAISLLVGGIGIMNIMLVSVTERTREIGLRRAVGAYDEQILFQFLTEALVLSGLGGLIGVGLSYSIAYGLGRVPSVTFHVLIQPDALVMALGVSLAAGMVFGLYPAIRATRLDPIEALRYE
jgi:putative ABC transport system permease protein